MAQCEHIGIIDSEIIYNTRSYYPNLACMKLSSYHKGLGDDVTLVLEYVDLDRFDKLYVSKIFTDTVVPDWLLDLDNVNYGGTGFFFDNSPNLPYDIEHCMPDYNLYGDWVQKMLDNGINRSRIKYFIEHSIGFMTRGCIRKCSFCVNNNKSQSVLHSPLSEFVNNSRTYICLWDDNVFACSDWRSVWEELISFGKTFQFKQGLDIRLLTREKMEVMKLAKYLDRFIFAFDNIDDQAIVEKRLRLWWKMFDHRARFVPKLFVLCGFDSTGAYDEAFWQRDIRETLERIKILMKYGAIPFLMRYKRFSESPYVKVYNAMATMTEPAKYHSQSMNDVIDKKKDQSVYDDFRRKYPQIVSEYFDLRLKDVNEYYRK